MALIPVRNNDGGSKAVMSAGDFRMSIEGTARRVADGLHLECGGSAGTIQAAGWGLSNHIRMVHLVMGKIGDGRVWEGKPRIVCSGHIHIDALVGIQVEMSSKQCI